MHAETESMQDRNSPKRVQEVGVVWVQRIGVVYTIDTAVLSRSRMGKCISPQSGVRYRFAAYAFAAPALMSSTSPSSTT